MTTRLVHIQCQLDDLCRWCLRPLAYLGRLCGVFVTLFGARDLYVVPVAKRGMYARASTELLRAAGLFPGYSRSRTGSRKRLSKRDPPMNELFGHRQLNAAKLKKGLAYL